MLYNSKKPINITLSPINKATYPLQNRKRLKLAKIRIN